MAVAILGAAAGYELGVGLVAGFGVNAGIVQFLVGLILAAAVVAAVVFLNLPKALIVALTAGAGASIILSGILLALGRISLAALTWGVVGAFIRASWFWFLVFLVLAGAGIAAQLLLPEEYTLAPYGTEELGSPPPMRRQLATG